MNRPLWDDAPAPTFPALDGDARADVVVVGLGASGLAALRALRDQGVDAVGVDAGAVGGGAAGRNGGFLLAGLATFQHRTAARLGVDAAAALHAATEAEIAAEAAALPGIVDRCGSLRLASTPDELDDCRAHAAALRAFGAEVAWYEGPEGTGLLLPRDGTLQPLARARAWAVEVAADGARLHEHTPVRALAPGRVVTDRGVLACDRVVVAVDGRLDRLLPELAPRVRTARLQMVGTAPAPEVRFPRPVYARFGDVYWRQLPDHRLALGGFRAADVDAEWTHDDAPSATVQDHLDRFLRDALHVRAAVTHRWAASVAYTDDGLPVLEEVRPGVWASGAYSGTGNVVGVLGARAAVGRALGGTTAWAELLDAARRAARA